MKLINYRCKTCGKDHEEYFSYDEIAEGLDKNLTTKCECGGELALFPYKNNPQVWKFLSSRVN